MRILPRVIALALLAALQACVTPPAIAPRPVTATAPVAVRGTVTILISIDGLRPADLDRGMMPTLTSLAASGVSGTMRPSFPTLTFPNHYTLVTGLRPDRHGIVSNTMTDARRPGVQFYTSNAAQVRDAFWWDAAEPIWVAAERAGIRSATMFWPGSEAAIRGIRPRDWQGYNADISNRQRADAVIDWMRRPAEDRPAFVTLYFSALDRASHDFGMESAQALAATRDIDAQIGRLVAALDAMAQPANLVIVSDHGMAPVPLAQTIPTAPILDDTLMTSIIEGPLLWITPLDGKDTVVAARLLTRHANFQCWRKGAMPPRFHFGTNARIAPFVCLTATGWRFSASPPLDYTKGDHGFDNDAPEMRAVFIAHGPGFARGRTLPLFDNVDVYPLLRDLIGLSPATGIDGSGAVFRPVRIRP